jgi:ribonuclease BN (tRNA processing enzyme)
MKVRFVGSGDAFGSGGRYQTGIHLSTGGQIMLVDCGATSLTALKAQRRRRCHQRLRGHPPARDHFGGLPFLILDGQFTGRTIPLLVAGPAGTSDRLAQANGNPVPRRQPGGAAVRRARDRADPDGTPAELGAATVRGWQVEHPSYAPPLALRVDLGGASFAYSGDTQWTPALRPVPDAQAASAAPARAMMVSKTTNSLKATEKCCPVQPRGAGSAGSASSPPACLRSAHILPGRLPGARLWPSPACHRHR